MLRLGLLVLVILPAALTSLTVDGPAPSPLRAGEHLEHALEVQLEGPAGPMPGAAGPVEVTLEAPEATGCSVPETVTLDPLTGHARVPLACRPAAVGAYPLNLTVRSPPHASATWTGTLPVVPDELEGTLTLEHGRGYRLPTELVLGPRHMDEAQVNLTLRGDLDGSPLAFKQTLGPIVADGSSLVDREILARHGPGTYTVTAHAEGPNVEAWSANATVDVPAPPQRDHVDLNVTVAPGQPTVALTSDGVNDDGKHKRPGDTLITRLRAEHANTVQVRVLRAGPTADVTIAETEHPVDANGRVEHTFTHPVLPAGLVRVQATAGNSSVARTAQISDVDAEASLEGPTTALGDGRALGYTLTIEDPNHGSTSTDPGPVWGLPDVTWRVYRGSHLVDGWTVQIGPFEGPAEGTAGTSRIAWPDGTHWAQVEDGLARVPLNLTPPRDVDPGTYRVSIYDPTEDRIGGTSFDLTAPPSVDLDAQAARPGQAWPVDVRVADPVPDLDVELVLVVDGQPVANRTLAGNGTARFDVPTPLAAGTRISAQAHADWPGRPATDTPDAELTREVPELAPYLALHTRLDGVPTAPPLALHPAGDHAVEAIVDAVDPNGDALALEARVLDPDGTTTGWLAGADEGSVRVDVPQGAPSGRYRLEVTAESHDGTNRTTVALDVGEITRLRLAGPPNLTLSQGETARANLTLRNDGTTHLEEALLLVNATSGLSVGLDAEGTSIDPGAAFAVDLRPGHTRTVALTVTAEPDAPEDGHVRVTAAGVRP